MVFDEQQKYSDKILANTVRERMMQHATKVVHDKLLMEPQESMKKVKYTNPLKIYLTRLFTHDLENVISIALSVS